MRFPRLRRVTREVGCRFSGISACSMNDKVPRLLLFDIDGTLTSSYYKDPVMHHPVALALSEAFERKIQKNSIKFAGGTDRSIIREVLQADGITEDNTADYEERVAKTLDILPGYMSRGVANGMHRWSALPNVHELLNRLSEIKDVQLALLTGNIVEDAKIKLQCASISISLFEVVGKGGQKELLGAFGTDHEIRSKLVPFARKRYSEYLSKPVTAQDMIIIGDSPKDVSCAHDNGVACVAVGTGPCSSELLANADYLLKDGFIDLEESIRAIEETQLRGS